MTKKITKKEKDKRWLELQKNRMHEKLSKQLPVFDGYEVKPTKINPRYGDIPETEEPLNVQK